MTKKHYIAIAAIFNDELIQYPTHKTSIMHIADNLSIYLKQDNPNFNYSRFLNAILKEEGIK
jgi:hypothetical protein